MWEIILFIIVAFFAGWFAGITFNRNIRKQYQKEKPEMMWFNEKKSRWERIVSLQLSVADRVVVEIPVKLVEEIR
jgi:hypothetical protein